MSKAALVGAPRRLTGDGAGFKAGQVPRPTAAFRLQKARRYFCLQRRAVPVWLLGRACSSTGASGGPCGSRTRASINRRRGAGVLSKAETVWGCFGS